MKKPKATMKELLAAHRAGKKFSCYDTHDRELVDRLLAKNRALRKELALLKQQKSEQVAGQAQDTPSIIQRDK